MTYFFCVAKLSHITVMNGWQSRPVGACNSPYRPAMIRLNSRGWSSINHSEGSKISWSASMKFPVAPQGNSGMRERVSQGPDLGKVAEPLCSAVRGRR